MILRQNEALQYYLFESLADQVPHGVFTRHGGLATTWSMSRQTMRRSIARSAHAQARSSRHIKSIATALPSSRLMTAAGYTQRRTP